MVHAAIRIWLLLIFIGIGIDLIRNCSAEKKWKNRHGRLPSYAWNASREAQKELKRILKSKTLTKLQIEDEASKWAKQQGPEIESAYAEFNEQEQSKYAKLKEAIEASSNLSSDARDALLRMFAVETDMLLTRGQEKHQVKAIFREVTKSVRREMKRFLHENFPKPKRYRDRREVDDDDFSMEGCDYLHTFNATQAECQEFIEEIYKDGLPFLDKLSSETRDEFFSISFNMTLPKRVVMDEVMNWAKQQGPEVEAAVKEMIENETALYAQAEKTIEELSVSSEVKEALHKIVEIEVNENLSASEQIEQIEKIMDDLPDEIGMQVTEKWMELDSESYPFLW